MDKILKISSKNEKNMKRLMKGAIFNGNADIIKKHTLD